MNYESAFNVEVDSHVPSEGEHRVGVRLTVEVEICFFVPAETQEQAKERVLDEYQHGYGYCLDLKKNNIYTPQGFALAGAMWDETYPVIIDVSAPPKGTE